MTGSFNCPGCNRWFEDDADGRWVKLPVDGMDLSSYQCFECTDLDVRPASMPNIDIAAWQNRLSVDVEMSTPDWTTPPYAKPPWWKRLFGIDR